MSFTSPVFLIATGLLVVAYYLIPRRFQWLLLLAVSYAFYASGGLQAIAFLLLTTGFTWAAGLILERLNGYLRDCKGDKEQQKPIKKQKKLVVLTACLLNFGMLFLLKYRDGFVGLIGAVTGNSVSLPDLIMPMGISFYMFQSIGYVVDVYRGKHKAQRNPAKFALFVSFFPQMIQGPISRYGQLAPQLLDEHECCWEDLRDGIQLALWGYMKKLIIAERIGVVANTVFADSNAYAGSILAVGVLAYSIQLYCDFSGGIDITRGIARMLGIDLVENFRRPLFAISLTDYWRRWHMSLGSWMREYVFYPLSLSKFFGKLGKWGRTHLPGRLGKTLGTTAATFVVYFLIGIWHGSSLKYIAFGFYNGILITVSMLLESAFVGWRKKLGMTKESKFWLAFRLVRTWVIVFIGRYLTRAPRLLTGLTMIWRTVFDLHPGALLNGTVLQLGLGLGDWLVVAAGVLVLVVVELAQERGVRVRSWLAKQNGLVQWAAVMFALLAILFFGLGGSYTPAQFIYAQY